MSIGQPSMPSLCTIFTKCFFSRQLNFIRAYLRTLGKEGSLEEERIMMEVRIFSLASHLFWGLWSIVNAKLSQIPFGYWVCILFWLIFVFRLYPVESVIWALLHVSGLCCLQIEELHVSERKVSYFWITRLG